MAPYMMRVLEAFAREGAEVELLCPRRRNRGLEGADPFEYHGIERNFIIKKLPVIDLMGILPGALGFYLMVVSFSAVVFLYVASSRERRRAVFYFFDLRDAWAILLFSRRAFSEIHMYYQSSADFINRWGFSRLRGLVVATAAMMQDIHALYGVEQARMLHAPCGVNSERFALDTSKEEARRTLGLPQSGRFIFYIGHLFPVKGVDVLFDANPMLQPGEIIYFIGGTEGDIKRFREKWKAAGEPQNVVVAGRKPHQEIPLWLRAADILVIPNTAKESAGSIESSPSKLLEYMASGRPIIASDVPGIRDVLSDSMGYFIEPDSPRAIAEAIRAVFADSVGAEAKSRTARAAAKNLSWEARARSILRFIEHTL